MASATVDDLRALIYTVQTDTELSNIISISSNILTGMGISADNARYKELHLYKSAVICLQRMQTNSEMAYMTKVGSIQQFNSDIIKTIKMYEDLFNDVLKSIQLTSTIASTYVISKQREEDYYE